MAKFCGNCGAQLDDNAKVCGMCGALLDDATTDTLWPKMPNPEKQKKVKKTVKSIVVLLLVLIVAAFAFNIISRHTGYNGLVRKVMKAYIKYDIDTLVSLSGDMYFYDKEDRIEDDLESCIDDTLDSFESSVGHSYKLSYKVNETYTLSKRKLRDILETVEYRYPDFDTDTIQKIVVADLTITAKQGKKSKDKYINIYMSKESGSWKLFAIK